MRTDLSTVEWTIGANPVPVAYAEVYTALQSGAIDVSPNDVALLVRKLAVRTTTWAALPNPRPRSGVDV